MTTAIAMLIAAALAVSTSPEAPYDAHGGSRVYLSYSVPFAAGYRAYWRHPGGEWQSVFYDRPAYYPETISGQLRHNGNVPLLRHLSTDPGTVVEICMTAYNAAGESACSESVFILWPQYEEITP